MRVRIVGPDDVLPHGSVTLDLPQMPRIGETIWLDDTHDQLVVRDVFWPIRVKRRGGVAVGEADAPEVACEYVGEVER